MKIIVAADKNWGIGKDNKLFGKHSGRYENVPSGNNRKGMRYGKENTGKLSGRASS